MWQKVKDWTKRPSSAVLAVILILTLVASFAVPVLAAESPPSFLLKWGTGGNLDGQFADPRGIAIDTAGNIYVADTANGRIQKFTGTGTFITKWNSGGTLNNPWGIDVSSTGYVYVSDMTNNRIQKFTTTGTWLANWTPAGSDNLSAPYGLCVDSSGNVYVADSGHLRIEKFDSNGNLLTKWSTTGYPYDVAADAAGNIYVADLGNTSIDKFTSTGTPITSWGSIGPGDGQFNGLKGVSVDSSGNVYVADSGNNRIQKFTSTGVFLSKWGSGPGAADGQFNNPYTLVATSWGYVYVPDSGNNRVQLFAYPPTSSASVNTATGTGTATFSTSNGSISGLTALTQSQVACGAKQGVAFPQGFFSFNINLVPGTTATVTIILPSAMPSTTQYWKCINGQWVNATPILGSNDGDSILTLTLTDGGPYDADGAVNGVIVDPGGPGVSATEGALLVPSALRASPKPPNTNLSLNPSQMSVQYLSVNPQQTSANQPVTISTNVVNTGDEAGNFFITLNINGQAEQTRTVSVGSHGTQPVKFTVTRAQPGTYAVDIEGQKASFIVNGAGNSSTSTSASGIVIAVLIFGVLAVIAVTAILLSRRTA